MQIWFLYFGPEACTERAQAGRSGFYRVLCALTLGEAPPPPSTAELDRLRVALERKPARTSSHRPGLIQQFRDTLGKDRELRGLARDEAMRRLLSRWRQQPFTFTFGSSGGGGSDDPGGGGSGMSASSGPRRRG